MPNKNYDYISLTMLNMLENTTDMMFIKDKNLKYVSGSRPFARLVNLDSTKDLVGKTDFDIFEKELALKYINDDKNLMKYDRPIINYLEPLPSNDDKKHFGSTSKYLLKDDNGEIIGLYGVSRDITAQIELEMERENKEVSSQFFEAILNADLTNDIMLQSKGFISSNYLHLNNVSTFTQSVYELVNNFIHPDFAEEFVSIYNREKLIASFNRGKTKFNHIIAHKTKDGKYYYELETKLFYSKVSESIKITTAVTDIDKDIKARERLQYLATTDSLTGLLNRAGAENKILKFLDEDNSNQKHALLFIDLDKFKILNDEYGHLYGDKVLRELSDKLSLFNDDNHIIGRFGGDEFIVFIKNVATIDILKQDINNYIEKLRLCKINNDKEINITCSIGVSICENNKSLKILYQEADEAMYKAKLKGKNCFSFYEKSNKH